MTRTRCSAGVLTSPSPGLFTMLGETSGGDLTGLGLGDGVFRRRVWADIVDHVVALGDTDIFVSEYGV